MARIFLIFILLITYNLSNLSAKNVQNEKHYLVLFKDKGTDEELLTPEQYLSQKALDRRSRQEIPIDESDYPVNQLYVDAVKQMGADVYFASRWLNGVLIYSDSETVEAIKELSFVDKVSDMIEKAQVFNPIIGTQDLKEENVAPDWVESDIPFGHSFTQVDMVGLDDMQADGYTGKGITIAVLDNGFRNLDKVDYFEKLSVLGTYDLVERDQDIYDSGRHGLSVLSLMAAYKEDEIIGGAYDADYYLFRTEDDYSESRLEELYWLRAAEMADSLGADIINSSLGYFDFDNQEENYSYDDLDGESAWITVAANFAASKGILVVSSAGNEGVSYWKRITFPSDSPFVLSVASVDKNKMRASTSSVGPTIDDRIKPDIAAMGQGIVKVNDTNTVSGGSGTSYAAPMITSLAAGLWQRFPLLTNFELMEKIKASGSQRHSPDNALGYGIANYILAVNAVTTIESSHIENWVISAVIYPNPTSENFFMNTEGIIGEQLRISFYDTSGKMLERQERIVTQKREEFYIPEETKKGVLLAVTEVGNMKKIFRVIVR